ncbi:MAG: hypothetical protein FWG58_04025 [Methanomassiliicoccaceae archaeon]|nr:hypothetical protein [Methanomassiliicoccaceae archaeon]
MGICMAICETECGNALCASGKKNILKVLVKDPSGYGDASEYSVFLPIEDAAALFGDWDGFVKRNKIKDDICTIYTDRLKDKDDREIVERSAGRTYTGWVDLSKVDERTKKELISASAPEDMQTEWDMLSFDDMNRTCAECILSWDKGRGCIGSFGPDNGTLPDIAGRYGCVITASIPDGVSAKRRYTSGDAKALMKEIPILRDALAKEGKQAVRRYSGPVDRLEAVAGISIKEGCGFRFF